MKKLLYLLTIFVLCVFLFYFFIPNYDRSNYYANKTEVIADNAIERGWIPSILPKSAYDIKEKHNLDTNELNGSFKYLEEDENDFLKYLKNYENVYVWENFIFEVDTQNNIVFFKNKMKM